MNGHPIFASHLRVIPNGGPSGARPAAEGPRGMFWRRLSGILAGAGTEIRQPRQPNLTRGPSTPALAELAPPLGMTRKLARKLAPLFSSRAAKHLLPEVSPLGVKPVDQLFLLTATPAFELGFARYRHPGLRVVLVVDQMVRVVASGEAAPRRPLMLRQAHLQAVGDADIQHRATWQVAQNVNPVISHTKGSLCGSNGAA